MAGRFSIEGMFRMVDRITRPVSRLSRQMSAVTRLTDRAGRAFQRFDRAIAPSIARMKTFGTVAAAAAAAGIAAVAKSTVATGANFEEAISAVGAVGLQTRDQIAGLEKKALELGAATQFTATQAANAMEIMARAGFKNEEILAGVGGVLSAAAASGLEMAEVANHVSNVLKGMGLEAGDAARVADVLALASARTNSSIGSLGESMKNLAPVARQLGVPMEQAVAAVALLQDVGLDASEAGTATATMLTKLAKPATDVAAKMRELGIAFQDAQGNALPLPKIFEQFDKAAKKSGGNMEVLAFFSDLVGLRGQKAALNLKDMFASGKLSGLTEELENAAGSAEKMAKLRMDNLKGDFELLKSAVEGVQVALFDTQSGPLRGIVQATTEWVTANQELIKSNVAEFLARAAPFVKGFVDALAGGFREAMPAIQGALGILFDGFGSGATWLDTIKSFAGILGKVTALAIGVATVFGGMVLAGIQLVSGAVNVLIGLWNTMIAGIGDAILWLDDLGARVSAGWTSLVDGAKSAARNLVQGLVDGIRNGAKWVLDAIKNLGSAAIDGLMGILGISSPSRVFAALGEQTGRGFELGIERSMPSTIAAPTMEAVQVPPVAIPPVVLEPPHLDVGRALPRFDDVMAAPPAWALPRGFDDDDEAARRAPARSAGAPGAAPQVVSPETASADRIVHELRESRTTERNELVIRDETRRAQFKKPPAKGSPIKLAPSGGF